MRGASAARVHGVTARGARWLRADVGDTVSVQRGATAGSAPVAASEIGPGLKRWSSRLNRRRALVLTRRLLLMVLAVALVAAIVILLVGHSRPWWLIAGLALAPLG